MTAPEIELQARLYELEQKLGGKDRETVHLASSMIRRQWQSLIHVQSVVKDALDGPA